MTRPYIYQDMNTGRFYMVNNHTGEKVPCEADGKRIRDFLPGISGIAKTKDRAQLVSKDIAWQKSLTEALPHPAPHSRSLTARPPATDVHGGSMAEMRSVCKHSD